MSQISFLKNLRSKKLIKTEILSKFFIESKKLIKRVKKQLIMKIYKRLK